MRTGSLRPKPARVLPLLADAACYNAAARRRACHALFESDVMRCWCRWCGLVGGILVLRCWSLCVLGGLLYRVIRRAVMVLVLFRCWLFQLFGNAWCLVVRTWWGVGGGGDYSRVVRCGADDDDDALLFDDGDDVDDDRYSLLCVLVL